jgi:DNA-binding NarL/FixJ family response regulator
MKERLLTNYFPTTVVVVDDDAKYLVGITSELDVSQAVYKTYASPMKALKALKQYQPNCFANRFLPDPIAEKVKAKEFSFKVKNRYVMLTQREVECLKKLSLGYSAKEIAKLLALSYRTVEDYLHNAKDKLGCSKRSEIIAIMLNQTHGLSEKIKTLHREIYNSQRFHEISVLVVDFDMPGMTGLELCEELADKPFKKLLLTGKADEKTVIQAFNEGKIQKYIHKDSQNFAEEMNRAVRELQRNYFEDLSAVVIK